MEVFVGIFAHHQLGSFEISFRYLKGKTAKLFHLDGKKAAIIIGLDSVPELLYVQEISLTQFSRQSRRKHI